MKWSCYLLSFAAQSSKKQREKVALKVKQQIHKTIVNYSQHKPSFCHEKLSEHTTRDSTRALKQHTLRTSLPLISAFISKDNTRQAEQKAAFQQESHKNFVNKKN